MKLIWARNMTIRHLGLEIYNPSKPLNMIVVEVSIEKPLELAVINWHLAPTASSKFSIAVYF